MARRALLLPASKKDHLKVRRPKQKASQHLAESDCVVVGSFVPEGVAVARWVLNQSRHACHCFYDLDTPVTLRKLQAGDEEYMNAALIARFDYYLSFAGGPVLDRLAKRFGVQAPIAFWCCVDPEIHFPQPASLKWDLAYLGTYSSDRQSKLNELMLQPAVALPEFSFAVCGPLYPSDIFWPTNVTKLEHANPLEHPRFYGSQRFCLNLTRDEMVRNGYSPSTRLFEAAACGTAIISDRWTGIESFFTPDREILIAENSEQMIEILRDYPDKDRLRLGKKARERVLSSHTAEQRVIKLEALVRQRSNATTKLDRDL